MNKYNTFDKHADNYHSARPGYPPLLFKDIQEECGINKKSNLLELGAGSGIATTELAKIAGRVVAIEPGENLAKICKDRTRDYGNVEVFVGSFEEFKSTDKFDAILAFTSFHWLGNDKFQRIDSLLEDLGSLIIVWNSFFQDNSPVTVDVNKAYHDFLPDKYPKVSTVTEINEGVSFKLKAREQEINNNPIFKLISARKYSTKHVNNSETYPRLLNSFPEIANIKDAKRKRFLDEVAEIVKRHGNITIPVQTTVLVCKKGIF